TLPHLNPPPHHPQNHPHPKNKKTHQNLLEKTPDLKTQKTPQCQTFKTCLTRYEPAKNPAGKYQEKSYGRFKKVTRKKSIVGSPHTLRPCLDEWGASHR